MRLENIMSLVIVDVDNDYCDELLYSYQIVLEDNGTYSVYVSQDILSGSYAGRNIETFFEAYKILNEAIEEHEGAFL